MNSSSRPDEVARPVSDLEPIARPGTGSAPTDEHLAMNALLTRVLLEAARRHEDELPGLVETVQDDMLLTVGGITRRKVDGWFQPGAWRFGERPVHELFLNADWQSQRSAASLAEDVLTTLLHESCHVWAFANDINDTSRDGRYHNHRFAQIALQIGLQIEKDPAYGHLTPGLTAQSRIDYGDLLTELESGLVLARQPRRSKVNAAGTTKGAGEIASAPSSSKYVFASCHCRAGRGRRVTIRVAAGSWRPGVIRCGVCQEPFVES